MNGTKCALEGLADHFHKFEKIHYMQILNRKSNGILLIVIYRKSIKQINHNPTGSTQPVSLERSNCDYHQIVSEPIVLMPPNGHASFLWYALAIAWFGFLHLKGPTNYRAKILLVLEEQNSGTSLDFT